MPLSEISLYDSRYTSIFLPVVRTLWVRESDLPVRVWSYSDRNKLTWAHRSAVLLSRVTLLTLIIFSRLFIDLSRCAWVFTRLCICAPSASLSSEAWTGHQPGAAGECEPWGWALNSGPLLGQYRVLTSEPTLQPHDFFHQQSFSRFLKSFKVNYT